MSDDRISRVHVNSQGDFGRMEVAIDGVPIGIAYYPGQLTDSWWSNMPDEVLDAVKQEVLRKRAEHQAWRDKRAHDEAVSSAQL